MNYRRMTHAELESLAYSTGSLFAQAELAARATEAVEAFEENERIITEMENETEDYCGKYNDLKTFLSGPVRARIDMALDMIDNRDPDDAAKVLESTLSIIDAETSL